MDIVWFLEGEVEKSLWTDLAHRTWCIRGCVEGCHRWALYVEVYGCDCTMEYGYEVVESSASTPTVV